jgi:hypothetical protein
MKYFLSLIVALIISNSISVAQDYSVNYPTAEIANEQVRMKLYIPDAENGYYRGTRFDWSGVVYSFEYKGHQYFGEWRPTHNPKNSSDITGPVNGFLKPGLGYDTALPGEEFVRIGVGSLEKPDETKYRAFETYKIVDNGKWIVNKGSESIEFIHELNCPNGWGYLYKKRIILTEDKPGFEIQYSLKNTGTKTIETDQFNHNFFVIDNTTPGPDFNVQFRFECMADNTPQNLEEKNIYTEKNKVIFRKKVENDDVWLSLKGFSASNKDNWFKVINKKTKAGIYVQGDTPLSKLIFWAFDKPLSPETFLDINVKPRNEMNWTTRYTVFTIK